MITPQQLQAIYKIYPQVVVTRGDEAFDADGNQIQYDIDAVNAKALELEAAEAQKQQQEQAAKESALTKLTALGLTTDEVKALLGL